MDKIKEILKNYKMSVIYICATLIAGLVLFTKYDVFNSSHNQGNSIVEPVIEETLAVQKIAGPSSLKRIAESAPNPEEDPVEAEDTNISSAYDSVNFEKLIMQLGRYTEPDPAEMKEEERARKEKELASKSELEKKQRDQIALSGAVMA